MRRTRIIAGCLLILCALGGASVLNSGAVEAPAGVWCDVPAPERDAWVEQLRGQLGEWYAQASRQAPKALHSDLHAMAVRTSTRWLALVGGLALAPPAAAQHTGELPATLRTSVDTALERAREPLLEHLRLQRGGVLALVCLAAVHDGVPADDPSMAHGLRRLWRSRLTGTYDLALRLMVLAEVDGVAQWEELAAHDTRALLQRRRRGGFTYAQPYESWDLSNSQYAALGLRAAVALGQTVEPSVWQELAAAVLKLQAGGGGFPYTEKHRRHHPYASMTVAGIAVLEICAQQLGDGAVPGLDEAVDRGWEWMARHRYEIGNVDVLSCYYFHYGLERAAILSDVTEVGDVDWYRRGAEMLVAAQRPSGAWRGLKEIRPGALPGESSPVDTAFAVLFLRRAFAKVLPVYTGAADLARLGDNAGAADVRRVAAALIRRGLPAMPEVLIGLRSRVAPRRRAAARVLVALAGRDFGYHPDRSAAAAAEAIKAAERWWLTEGREGRD
ncbi:MAG: hypothetical protein AAF628_13075 [Planctomycetota bacterium]